MPRGDRRAEILKVAEKLFASGRFHEVTLDEVAHEARVGKGTIYRYFQDKDDLFFQVMVSGFEDLCERLEQEVPRGAPFEQQLLAACREIDSFFDRRRRTFRLMHSAEGRMPWKGGGFRKRFMVHRDRLEGVVAAIIERGVAEGKVRRDLPPCVLGRMLLGIQRGWAREPALAAGASRGVEVVVDFFCRAARPD